MPNKKNVDFPTMITSDNEHNMTVLMVKAMIDTNSIPSGTMGEQPTAGNGYHGEDEKTAHDEDEQINEDWSEEDHKTVLHLWNRLNDEEKEAAARASYQYCLLSARGNDNLYDDQENGYNIDDMNANSELEELREEYGLLMMRRFWVAIRDIPFTAFGP